MNAHIPYIMDRTVWKQSTLDKDNSWIYHLNDSDILELNEALSIINSKKIISEDINKENFNLGSFGRKLTYIQDYIENDRGIFLIRGLPVDQYEISNIRRMFLGICTYIGTPVVQSTQGEILQDVCNIGEGLYDDKGRGTNTNEQLPWHTDRSDVVSLLCINPAMAGGQSMVASLTHLHNIIKKERPDLSNVLMESFYHARAPFEPKDLSPWYKLPIFTMKNDKFAGRYLRHFITISQDIKDSPELSDLQMEALDYMDKRLNDPDVRVDIFFRKGDIQIINNFTIVHSRERYSDTKDRTRFLLRAWLSVPNSRELIADFRNLYGDTKAGSLRGGILNTAIMNQIS